MIDVTFVLPNGKDAGYLQMDQIPRVGDTVLWLTYVVEDGEELERYLEYPVTAVRWILTSDEHREPSGPNSVRVIFGPTITPGLTS